MVERQKNRRQTQPARDTEFPEHFPQVRPNRAQTHAQSAGNFYILVADARPPSDFMFCTGEFRNLGKRPASLRILGRRQLEMDHKGRLESPTRLRFDQLDFGSEAGD